MIQIVTIYDTYCCIFILRNIVARYIVTPLLECDSAFFFCSDVMTHM